MVLLKTLYNFNRLPHRQTLVLELLKKGPYLLVHPDLGSWTLVRGSFSQGCGGMQNTWKTDTVRRERLTKDLANPQKPKRIKRRCLKCDETFLAMGRFNRICPSCRGLNRGIDPGTFQITGPWQWMD